MATTREFHNIIGRLSERGRLAHGYLVFGEDEGTLAASLEGVARFLETSSWTSEDVLLDVRFFDGEAFGIDEARELGNFLYQSPFRAPRRTACITRADRMSIQA